MSNILIEVAPTSVPGYTQLSCKFLHAAQIIPGQVIVFPEAFAIATYHCSWTGKEYWKVAGTTAIQGTIDETDHHPKFKEFIYYSEKDTDDEAGIARELATRFIPAEDIVATIQRGECEINRAGPQ